MFSTEKFPLRDLPSEIHSSNADFVRLRDREEPMSDFIGNENDKTAQEKYKAFINCEYPAAEGGLS